MEKSTSKIEEALAFDSDEILLEETAGSHYVLHRRKLGAALVFVCLVACGIGVFVSHSPSQTNLHASRQDVIQLSGTDCQDVEHCSHERCPDAQWSCYHATNWAMTAGILQNPEWYSGYEGLTANSPFSAFQCMMHAKAVEENDPHNCPLPCSPCPYVTPTGPTPAPAASTQQAPSAPSAASEQTLSAASACKTVDICKTSVCPDGEWECYKDVLWAMNTGCHQGINYNGLNQYSSFEEYQQWMQDNKAGSACPVPCPTTTTTTRSYLKRETVAYTSKGCPPRDPVPDAPDKPLDYNGISWPTMCFTGDQTEHVFVMGDWGALERNTNEWGSGTRPAMNYRGRDNPAWGIDDNAQQLVADQMQKRAARMDPRYILNAGDNFYWGGLGGETCPEICGKPKKDILSDWNRTTARNTMMFFNVFDNMYKGEGLDGKAFLGVLGNHDWGGFLMNAGWDQQIYYTWSLSSKWVMPALYWHQHVDYPDKEMSVDYYMLDTNNQDAHPHWEDAGHNICGTNNKDWATCKSINGPIDVHSCHEWFASLWAEQVAWLEEKLAASEADWQIVVTHFPPDPPPTRKSCYTTGGQSEECRAYTGIIQDIKRLGHAYGIDLIFGSHRHQTEMFPPMNPYMVHGNGAGCDTPYVVVGGGGGITSEQDPRTNNEQYGFIDMIITKDKLACILVNQAGQATRTMNVEKRHPEKPGSCKSGCDQAYHQNKNCQCTLRCEDYGDCCPDYATLCPTPPDVADSCLLMGCNGDFEANATCQCTAGCTEDNTCCSDYQTVCDLLSTTALGQVTLPGDVNMHKEFFTTTRPTA